MEELPMSRLTMKESVVIERVLKTISRYNMLPPGVRVIAAVSGGPDSVCLLHVLRELNAPLAGVAHFNHKLRGAESDLDERFVAAMAGDLGLPFFRNEADSRQVHGNLEQAARDARRLFFASLGGRIATGHTRDDQAETVLFRILRGTGLTGLAGIHPVTKEGLMRPLLDVTRAEVLEFLTSRGIPYREDSSNREARFARNRIRHELLPQLKRDWNPKITDALAHLADLAYKEEAGQETGRGPGGPPHGRMNEVEIDATALDKLPIGEARRLVRQAIARAKGDLRRIEYRHIEQVLDLSLEAWSGRVSLPGLEVTRSFDWIRFAPPSDRRPVEPVAVEVPGTYAAPDGATLIRLEKAESASCVTLRVELSWGRISAPVELRGWRPGDHYRPAGQSRDQKLKDLFQIERVPSWRRRFWPILTSGGKILWARGFGAAQEFVAGDGQGPVLRIEETPEATIGTPV